MATLTELQEAVTESLLQQAKAVKTAEPKDAAAVLKVAAEFLKNNHIELPKPPDGHKLSKLAQELAEIPEEWDDAKDFH